MLFRSHGLVPSSETLWETETTDKDPRLTEKGQTAEQPSTLLAHFTANRQVNIKPRKKNILVRVELEMFLCFLYPSDPPYSMHEKSNVKMV